MTRKKLSLLVGLLFIALGIVYISVVKPFVSSQPQVAFEMPAPRILDEEKLYQEEVITSVVEVALPSVVTIGVSESVFQEEVFSENPFDLFIPPAQQPNDQQDQEVQNIGSGFIVTKDGLIVTNKHVVDRGDIEYQVRFNSGEILPVKQIARDPLNDLAIIKVDANNLSPLPLGDSSNLKLGQIAIAIGTPLGEFTNTVTTGIISGLGRGITAGSPFQNYVEQLENVIQTDAAISPGNSGGPLLNSSGEVVGVNTAVSLQGQNLGFAIPVNVAKDLVNEFQMQGGEIVRPYIGVRYVILSERQLQESNRVPGAYVLEVIADSPAEQSGIQEGDIITKIAGQDVTTNQTNSVLRILANHQVGETVPVTLWRDGETLEVLITLAKAAN